MIKENPSFKTYTIFRVVGGSSQRKNFADYEIVPYLVVNETNSHWVVCHEGGIKKIWKDTTSNTEWIADIDAALVAVEGKVAGAMHSIHSSMMAVSSISFIGMPYRDRLYIGKFNSRNLENNEQFTLSCYRIIKQTNKAWHIDTERTKEVETKSGMATKPVGKSYIYPHESMPHDPKNPREKWIGTSLDIIKSLMKLYGEDRIKYLHTRNQYNRDFVKQYKKNLSAQNEH